MLSGCSVLRQEAIQMSCSYQIIELVSQAGSISIHFYTSSPLQSFHWSLLYSVGFYRFASPLYLWQIFIPDPKRSRIWSWTVQTKMQMMRSNRLSLRKKQNIPCFQRNTYMIIWFGCCRYCGYFGFFGGCSKMASHCQVQIVAGNLCHRAPGACDERLPW